MLALARYVIVAANEGRGALKEIFLPLQQCLVPHFNLDPNQWSIFLL